MKFLGIEQSANKVQKNPKVHIDWTQCTEATNQASAMTHLLQFNNFSKKGAKCIRAERSADILYLIKYKLGAKLRTFKQNANKVHMLLSLEPYFLINCFFLSSLLLIGSCVLSAPFLTSLHFVYFDLLICTYIVGISYAVMPHQFQLGLAISVYRLNCGFYLICTF